jgi:hypothetical protein
MIITLTLELRSLCGLTVFSEKVFQITFLKNIYFCQGLGFSAVLLSNRIRGEARTVGSAFAEAGIRIASGREIGRGLLGQLGVREPETEKIETASRNNCLFFFSNFSSI